jgi:hypothetical protein
MVTHNWDNNRIVDVHDPSGTKLFLELSKVIRVRHSKQAFFGYSFLTDAPLNRCRFPH